MLVIAHRGASGHAPENTMAAFRQALQMGAKAIEFDVHLTRDEQLVVAHDDDLKRCGGDRRRLSSLRWKGDAQNVDVGSWYDKRFASERLPRLEDLFDLTPSSVELHLEIKHGSTVYPGIENKVVDMIRRRDATDRTVVSSFDHRALSAVRALDRDVRLGYLLGSTGLSSGLRQMQTLSAESLHVSMRQVTGRLVKAAHGQDFRVYVYTVNTPEDRDRLARIYVDGIFSNYPELDLWR